MVSNVLIFSPLLGEIHQIWRSYVSNGLVQPPPQDTLVWFASNFHGSKKRVSQNSFLEVPATEVRSLTNARLEYKTNVETKVWSLVDFAWMSLGARWWKLQKTGTEFSPQKWRLLLFRIWGICYLCLTSERNDLEFFFWRFVPVWSHTQADTVRSRVTKTYCRSLFLKNYYRN